MPITTNAIMIGARGTFGKQVVFKKYGDKTVISNVPDFSDRVLTPKQVKNTKTMSHANYYAKGILEDEELRNAAQLRLNVQRNKLYHALIREYYQKYYNNEAAIDADANTLRKAEINVPFIAYLLENTDKSIEDIAQLTNSTTETVLSIKNKRS